MGYPAKTGRYAHRQRSQKGTQTVDRDYRSILDGFFPARCAQVVECRAETFAGVFILIMPKRASVGSRLPRSGATDLSGEQDRSYRNGDRKWPLLDALPTK
jgi:hypothetical protein